MMPRDSGANAPVANDITLDMGDYQIGLKGAYVIELTRTSPNSGYTELTVRFQVPTTAIGKSGYSVSTKKLQVPKVNKRQKKKVAKKKTIKKIVTQEQISETLKDIEHVWN